MTTDLFRFLVADAASVGDRLVWEFDESIDAGMNANNPPSGQCFGLLLSFLCYSVPFDTMRISDVVPQGTITVRVYQAAQTVSIEIDTIYGPLENGSFTARENEGLITLKAKVTPTSLEPSVHWTIALDENSFQGTKLPTGPITGATTSFIVALPDDPRNRWPSGHPGTLSEKQFGYTVHASVTTNGTTLESERSVVQQVEKDVLREEYIEFTLDTVPLHVDLAHPGTTPRQN